MNMKVLDHLGRSCDYSPDGSLIAVGMKDGTVIVMKADTLEDIKRLNNRSQEISDVRFSPSK